MVAGGEVAMADQAEAGRPRQDRVEAVPLRYATEASWLRDTPPIQLCDYASRQLRHADLDLTKRFRKRPFWRNWAKLPAGVGQRANRAGSLLIQGAAVVEASQPPSTCPTPRLLRSVPALSSAPRRAAGELRRRDSTKATAPMQTASPHHASRPDCLVAVHRISRLALRLLGTCLGAALTLRLLGSCPGAALTLRLLGASWATS